METFDYEKVIELIKAPFPNGTVQFRSDNGRAYIPNQVYTDRIEAATNGRWSREIKSVEINVPQGYVTVIARVTIGDHFRDGVGFAVIDKGANVTNKVDQAFAEAVREALDTWQIGWKDLAPYYKGEKDWGSNPALQHLLQSAPPSQSHTQSQSRSMVSHSCIYPNCGKQLTRDEWDFLGEIPNLNREKMKYCFTHIPPHLKKRAPADITAKYEERILGFKPL